MFKQHYCSPYQIMNKKCMADHRNIKTESEIVGFAVQSLS